MKLTFKEEQAVWYQKLKDSGFKDAENSETRLLNKWCLQLSSGDINFEHYLFNQRYYELASQFIHTPEFKAIIKVKPKYETIWIMHAEGYVQRLIAKEVHMNLCHVGSVIKKLGQVMIRAHREEVEMEACAESH